MEVESFWRGYWSATFSPTFPSSIVVTRHKGTSRESISAMSQGRIPITVPKENHFAIAVNRAGVRVLSIVRQKRNVRDVRKRSYVPQVAIANCLFIGRSQRDKRPACWQARQLTSTRNELVTRSKRCSPN